MRALALTATVKFSLAYLRSFESKPPERVFEAKVTVRPR